MFPQNHRTAIPRQKGAPLRKLRPGFASSNFYSQHVTSRNRRKPRRISYIKFSTRNKNPHSSSITLTALGDGHAVPSIFAVTPAASTKVPKLMDTLCDPFRIAILSGATRAKDLSALAQLASDRFLTRYTCRDKTETKCHQIKKIAKNFSIHFRAVCERYWEAKNARQAPGCQLRNARVFLWLTALAELIKLDELNPHNWERR